VKSEGHFTWGGRPDACFSKPCYMKMEWMTRKMIFEKCKKLEKKLKFLEKPPIILSNAAEV
jgi:hypothetical protein